MMRNRINRNCLTFFVVTIFAICSCKSTSTQLTPEMKEYRLSEIINELGTINSQGLISSLSSDDSTLIVTVAAEPWQAATLEEQNRVLEELGASWLEVSEKIGVKGDDLRRLRAVAVDRFQNEHARWSVSDGVKR